MKTIESFRKITVFTAMFVTVVLFSSCASYAQKKEDKEKNGDKTKNEQIHIKILKKENGKVVKIDTTITKDGTYDIDDIDDQLKSMNINLPGLSFNIDVDDESDDGNNSDSGNKKRKVKKSIVTMDLSCTDLDHLDEKIEKAMKEMQINCVVSDNDDEDIFFDFPFTEAPNTKVYKNVIKLGDGNNTKTKKRIIIDIDEDSDESNGSVVKETEYVRIKVKITDPSESEKKLVQKAGVNDNKLNIDNLLFTPDPGSKTFNLAFSLKEKSKTNIKIFDINGKEIYSENVKDFSGNYNKSIDLSGKTSGIYLLVIVQDGKSYCKKIAVQ